MKTALALVASLLAASASASGLVRSSAPLPAEMGATDHYLGQVTISGRYTEDEAGELCFKPDRAARKKLKVVPATALLCFSNEEQAARLLRADQAIAAIDTRRVCAITGAATVTVSGLWVGEGPAARWYTTRLVRVQKAAPPELIACGA